MDLGEGDDSVAGQRVRMRVGVRTQVGRVVVGRWVVPVVGEEVWVQVQVRGQVWRQVGVTTPMQVEVG